MYTSVYKRIPSAAIHLIGTPLMHPSDKDKEVDDSGLADLENDGPKLLDTLSSGYGEMCCITWSPEGDKLAGCETDSGGFWHWDVPGNRDLGCQLHHMEMAYFVDWSPDGKKFSLGGNMGVACWDIEAGWKGSYLGGYDGYVGEITWSPDSTKIAGACDDGEEGEKSIKIWDSTTGDELLVIDFMERSVVSVDWSPDGTMLASGGFDNTVSIWDASTGEKKLGFLGHSKWVDKVAWNFDCTKVASCGPDKSIRLWEISSGKEILTIKWKAECVAWSPDGSKLASCSRDDQKVKIWDALSGEILYTLKGHQDGVSCISWRSCGEKIASCSSDETVKIWSVPL